MEARADRVVVSKRSFDSDEPYAIVDSNISFVNALLHEQLRPDELPADALRSYYVDFYRTHLKDGGFSQFVYDSRWNPLLIAFVREGLLAIGAARHLVLFDAAAAAVESFGAERLNAYLASAYFGDNAEREELNALGEGFSEVAQLEDLIGLNAAWLRGLPQLSVMTIEGMQHEIRLRVAAIPDMADRVAAKRAREPAYLKLIRRLCARAQQTLVRVTAADPSQDHAGEQVIAYHFITDQGHYFMIENGGRAFMFDRESQRVVCEVKTAAK